MSLTRGWTLGSQQSWGPVGWLWCRSLSSWEIPLYLSNPTVCDILTTLWAFCRSRRHWTRVRQSPETEPHAQSSKRPRSGGSVSWSPRFLTVTSIGTPTERTRQSLFATFLFCFLMKDKNLGHSSEVEFLSVKCDVLSSISNTKENKTKRLNLVDSPLFS